MVAVLWLWWAGLALGADDDGVLVRVRDTVVAAGPEATWVWRAVPHAEPQQLPPSRVVAVSPDGEWVATERFLFRVGLDLPVLAWPEAQAVGFDEASARVTTRHGDELVVRRVPRAVSKPRTNPACGSSGVVGTGPQPTCPEPRCAPRPS